MGEDERRAGIDDALLKSLPEAERGTIGQLPDGRPNGFLVDASRVFPVPGGPLNSRL